MFLLKLEEIPVVYPSSHMDMLKIIEACDDIVSMWSTGSVLDPWEDLETTSLTSWVLPQGYLPSFINRHLLLFIFFTIPKQLPSHLWKKKNSKEGGGG